MTISMHEVLDELKTVIEEDKTLQGYNQKVLFYPLDDTGLPPEGGFSHCIVLWPIREPEEEERIGKRADTRFDIQVTAIVQGGFDHKTLLLGDDEKHFIGIAKFVGDLKTLLRFNSLENLQTIPGGNVREVDYIVIPNTQAIKARFIYSGYIRQAV